MARSIREIKNEMTANFIADNHIRQLYGLTEGKSFEDEFSTVSLESLLFYIVASAMWTLEKLFDLHITEASEQIALLKPHSLKWYRNKAQNFQWGFSLKTDSDVFDNGTATYEQIENSKIITYAAVSESKTDSRLVIKIATEQNDKLQQITPAQRDSFEAYIQDIKDAGVNVSVVNYPADQLKVKMTIYCDPLVIDSQGNSILEGGRPVENTIKTYLKNMPFNGELVLAHLVDALQEVKGVVIPHIISVQSNNVDSNGLFQPVDVRTTPASGYFEITDFDSITYTAYSNDN